MAKIDSNTKRAEFTRLYLTGKYTQKDLADKVGVSRQTAVKWVREIQPLAYFTIRKQLTNELERIAKRKNYEADRDTISQLITDIERIERLIIKAKYIPHLTQQ